MIGSHRDPLNRTKRRAAGTRSRRYLNVIVTMLLGGLWHGAGWSYMAWGGLHGAYLVMNHLWQLLTRRTPASDTAIARVAVGFERSLRSFLRGFSYGPARSPERGT